MGSGFPCWRLRASHQDPVAGESQDTGRVEADSRSNQDVGDGSADLVILTMRDTPRICHISREYLVRIARPRSFFLTAWHHVCIANLMASLQAVRVKGNNYYRLVTCRRIGGKPTPVVLAYLGKAEAIHKRLEHAQEAPRR